MADDATIVLHPSSPQLPRQQYHFRSPVVEDAITTTLIARSCCIESTFKRACNSILAAARAPIDPLAVHGGTRGVQAI
jgi:hypothetical protein